MRHEGKNMAANPIAKLKRRLGAAIDWRVRDAIELRIGQSYTSLEMARQTDRIQDQAMMSDSMAELGRSLTHISATLTEQQQALGRLLEELDRRITVLEKRPPTQAEHG